MKKKNGDKNYKNKRIKTKEQDLKWSKIHMSWKEEIQSVYRIYFVNKETRRVIKKWINIKKTMTTQMERDEIQDVKKYHTQNQLKNNQFSSHKFTGQTLSKMWNLLTLKRQNSSSINKNIYQTIQQSLKNLQSTILQAYQLTLLQIDQKVIEFKQNFLHDQQTYEQQILDKKLIKYKDLIHQKISKEHQNKILEIKQLLKQQFGNEMRLKEQLHSMNIKKQLEKYRIQLKKDYEINKPILYEPQNSFKISHFFGKKIKKINLLFKASQHNFHISKFYQTCQNSKNLIIICKTLKDKILGGYTPLSFTPTPNQINHQFGADSSNSTFLFSLNQNQKFQLKNSNYAIQRVVNKHYIIFGNHELQICNAANQNHNNCFTLSGTYYNTDKYNGKVKESHVKITGYEDHSFLVKQWEAYAVEFW